MRPDYTLISTPRPPSLDAGPVHVNEAAAAAPSTTLQVAVALPLFTALVAGWSGAPWAIALAIALAGTLLVVLGQARAERAD